MYKLELCRGFKGQAFMCSLMEIVLLDNLMHYTFIWKCEAFLLSVCFCF